MQDVKIISVENLEGTIRTMVKIKGHLFKRLWHPSYPVVWEDEEGVVSTSASLTKDQENDLEGILLAFVNSQIALQRPKIGTNN